MKTAISSTNNNKADFNVLHQFVYKIITTVIFIIVIIFSINAQGNMKNITGTN
jgi:hypothetical protein